MVSYVRDPKKIEKNTYDIIRELAPLGDFSEDEQQVALHMVRACGEPNLVEKLRISPKAVKKGKKAIKNYAPLLYDYDTVQCGLKTDLLYQEPLCFINKANVVSQAKANGQTRSMTAVDHWKPYLKNAITLFGHSSTALLYLLEQVKAGTLSKPELIIATPPGFVNTETAKCLLESQYDDLGIEYILIAGQRGGSILAAAAMNALLLMHNDHYV